MIGDLKVPNVTGKNLEEAKKIISESKLKLGKITYQTNNELPPGQIIDQYPKVNKTANENTTVDLFVARKKVIVQTEIEEEPTGDESKTETGTEDELSKEPDIKKVEAGSGHKEANT